MATTLLNVTGNGLTREEYHFFLHRNLEHYCITVTTFQAVRDRLGEPSYLYFDNRLYCCQSRAAKCHHSVDSPMNPDDFIAHCKRRRWTATSGLLPR